MVMEIIANAITAAKLEGLTKPLSETSKSEIGNNIEKTKLSKSEILQSQMETIKTTSLETLRLLNNENLTRALTTELEKKTVEQVEVTKVKCINEHLEGTTHPETGVPFIKKIIEVKGKLLEVVVPEFESLFDAQLPEELYEARDKAQEKECNRQLKEAIEKDPKLKEKFTDEQLEQIMNGDTPDGYTWHHDAEAGKMQLVDSEIHSKTGHTGGKQFWSGGSENR
jgi:hypothetical protein